MVTSHQFPMYKNREIIDRPELGPKAPAIRNEEGQVTCEGCGFRRHRWERCYHNRQFTGTRGWRFLVDMNRPWNTDIPLPAADDGEPVFDEKFWQERGEFKQIRE